MLEVILNLFYSGGQPNARDNEQRKPGSETISYYHDIPVYDAGRYVLTPLHYAAGLGQSEAYTTLLDRGANAKARDVRGKRPIDLANGSKMTRDATFRRLHDASY
ncbi:MAG: hypothetical protein ACPGQQ_07295 [Candidatus Puniceispirillaceae bacterium]